MSIPRRLGRLARGFVSNIDDERLRETIRVGREHGETLRGAFEAAWRGAAEEWRAAEERARERAARERAAEGRASEWHSYSTRYVPKRYPSDVMAAYRKLNLGAEADLEEVRRKRRELVKRYHPDRFVDPEQRKRAERLTAEINAAHDTIERHLLRG